MYKNLIKRIQEEFSDNPDLILKETKITTFKTVYCFFLETLSGSDKVNDYILKVLASLSSKSHKKIDQLSTLLPSPNTVKINKYDEIEFYLYNGFTVVFTNFNKEIIAVETKADLDRSISTPDSQPAVIGPKDAFTENYQKNIGLIKRRVKNTSLKTDEVNIGRKTNTKVGILYFDDVADTKLVKKIHDKVKKMDIDGITDVSHIAQYITNESKSVFPTALISERPDLAVNALLEGKVVIVMDTTPYVLVVPAFLVDFINPVVDNYNKSKNVNTIKILRFAAFFITIMTPAIYVAFVCFNQETIPTSLLINFSIQRSQVPFPAIIECLLMLLIVEILRESDLRFPSNYGSAISILGALIIGDAAVNAGLFSPIMIIVVAITLLSSMIFTDQELIGAIRKFRVLFIIGASFLGLFGVILIFFYFLIHITSIETFGKAYTYALSPYDKTYFQKTIQRTRLKKDTKRSKVLAKTNKTKQREN